MAPTPYLVNHDHYRRLISQLIGSGVMLDEGMLCWYARLSARYPTVELRIGDVCPTVDEAVLVGAHWRAAHDGLEGSAVDLTTGELRPAWDVLYQLVGRLGPALERHGDHTEVTSLLETLRQHGTSAARQRSAYARTGRVEDVVADVARQTRGEAPG
ncbi:hypothetical protein GCM10011608_31370 [Micromonospora sonchi]|uniref:Uncharacterized protein n=1 Tax=Micromonospora sonchi TaxID=1763543 RepID=A0A917TY46_9ACTN|nr:hypothetical protein [Micromonospora sonchi]GGM44377.1 hypothetical protein GCM10011608_31370 [Micromonospora sonchi]